MQLAEPFLLTFGDADSILLASLLLVLLFCDMPFLSPQTPYFLFRTSRRVWLAGQLLYVVLATTVYMIFIFLSTVLLCMQNSFIGNVWSETAAMLGYSGAGGSLSLPIMVKTMEMSTPYICMLHIFLLMLCYTIFLCFVMFFCNIKKGQFGGIVAVVVISLFGFLINPDSINQVLQLDDQLKYIVNLISAWVSPLSHATYHMHSFGYDLLPTLGQSYLIFAGLIILFYIFSFFAIRKYNFQFTAEK